MVRYTVTKERFDATPKQLELEAMVASPKFLEDTGGELLATEWLSLDLFRVHVMKRGHEECYVYSTLQTPEDWEATTLSECEHPYV